MIKASSHLSRHVNWCHFKTLRSYRHPKIRNRQENVMELCSF